MKKVILFSALCIMAAIPAAGARSRVAVFDFTVQFENPAYEKIGKGFTELMSLELDKSPGVSLLQRKKKLEFLEAMHLSMPDLDDSKVRLLASNLLKVDFLVFGRISETGEGITFQSWMTEGTSGEVVWNEQSTEEMACCELISVSFVRSLLDYLGAKAADSTVEKTTAQRSVAEDAFLAFSEAVDYLDKDDREKAEKALIAAAAIDPEMEAIQIYMQRMEWSIEVASPRFGVESAICQPMYNPASLGFIEQDRFFVSVNLGLTPVNGDGSFQEVDGYSLAESHGGDQQYGYMLPLGKRLGLGAEIISAGYDKSVNSPDPFDYQGSPETFMRGSPRFLGGIVSLGYGLSDEMSLGGSVLFWNTARSSPDDYMVDGGFDFAIEIGYMLKSADNRRTFDLSAAYRSLAERYVDFSALEVKEGALPLIVEASLSSAFLNRKLLAAFKGISNIYIDGRGGYLLRAVPVLEYQAFPFLSFRAGGEYSHLDQFGEIAFGYGGLAGFTAEFWRIALSGNFSIRKKPTDLVPGKSINDWTLLIMLNLTPSFMER